MKRTFSLKRSDDTPAGGYITIIGGAPDGKPYLAVKMGENESVYINDHREIERFAVNVLKLLGSKKLK